MCQWHHNQNSVHEKKNVVIRNRVEIMLSFIIARQRDECSERQRYAFT